jgi:hypothetical protein
LNINAGNRMTESGGLRQRLVLFYEVSPTGILGNAQKWASSAGFPVSTCTGLPINLKMDGAIVVAHCAEAAWLDLKNRAPEGAVCLHVSSVRRPRVPPPRTTYNFAHLIEAVPGVPEIQEADWIAILHELNDAVKLDQLIRRPAESPLAHLVLTIDTPLVLCSLLMLTQAFLDAPSTLRAEMSHAGWWLNAFSRLPERLDETVVGALRRRIAVEICELPETSDSAALDHFVSGLDCPAYSVTAEIAESVRSTLDRLLYWVKTETG